MSAEKQLRATTKKGQGGREHKHLSSSSSSSSSCKSKLYRSWIVFVHKLFHIRKQTNNDSAAAAASKSKQNANNNNNLSLVNSTTSEILKAGTAAPFSLSSCSLNEEEEKNDDDLSLLEDFLNAIREEERDDFINILAFPKQVREVIYSFLTPKDILSLRLISKSFKTDVERCHGLKLRIHDGQLDYEPPLQSLGVRELNVEHFTEESEVIHKTFFPIPELLKTLILSGPISQRNLDLMLQIFFNLTNLVITLDLSEQQLLTCDFKRVVILDNLKRLEISSRLFPTQESTNTKVSRCISNIMKYVHCPIVSSFKFRIVGCVPESNNEFHALAKIFVLKNRKSLKQIDITIVEVIMAEPNAAAITTAAPPNFDIMLMRELSLADVSFQFKLDSIQLTIVTFMEQTWRSLINAQTHLSVLKLNTSGQIWSCLGSVLENCGKTLRIFSVTGLSTPLNSNNSSTRIPLDMALLQNMEVLENLEIQHEDYKTEGFSFSPPSIIRTSTLQITLKSVKLRCLQLKPYQALFFFLKLPNIQKIVLDFWADSEGTLAGFMDVLIFLIKFNQTPARMVEMTDFRRKFENIKDSLIRMENMLRNHAEIVKNHSELYSTLSINKY